MTSRMKLGLATVLAATAVMSSAADAKWNTDLNKALALAKKTKKSIMIDFYADW